MAQDMLVDMLPAAHLDTFQPKTLSTSSQRTPVAPLAQSVFNDTLSSVFSGVPMLVAVKSTTVTLVVVIAVLTAAAGERHRDRVCR